MRYFRTGLLVLAMVLVLANGPAQAKAKSAPKPKSPTCGGWEVVYSPSPNGNGYLTAVEAVPGTTELWAVGIYNANFHWQTLIEHYDGTSWQVVPSPNVANADHYVEGLTVVSANDVWAVGRYEPLGGGSRTLTMHWDGTQWSIVPSPNSNSTIYNELWAVAAESPDSVWAVGYHYASGPGHETLIEHWDGTQWTIVPSPNVGNHDNILGAVTVVSDLSASLLRSPVWATGYYYRNDGSPSTLILRWDGMQWVVVPSPDGSTRENYLSGIGGNSRNDLWAVGVYNRPDGLYLALSEHWDGERWQVTPALSPSSSYTELVDVAAVSSGDMWAVGTYYNNSSCRLTLAEHWNGSNWQIAYTPNPAGEDMNKVNVLSSVTYVPGVGFWAVGYYQIPGTQAQTLVEFYCP